MNPKYYFAIALIGLLLSGCATQRPRVAPGTIPAPARITATDLESGKQTYQEFTKKYQVDSSPSANAKVRRVTNRLTEAAGSDPLDWTIIVLKAPSVKNAAVTRGNFVYVWSGLLELVQNDAELAVIIGHEIAHGLANHTVRTSSEEFSELIAAIAGVAAQAAVAHQGVAAQGVGNLAGGLTQEVVKGVVIYPQSRQLEYEADQIGLFLMARAGYNPTAAITFWERAQNDTAFRNNLEFFSSHPASADRIENLRQHLPAAMKNYQQKEAFPTRHNQPSPSHSSMPQALPRDPRKTEKAWIVVDKRVPIYRNPDAATEPVGFLEVGQLVIPITLQGRWLKISSPKTGFVRSYQLAPTS